MWDDRWDVDRACELAEQYVTAAEVEDLWPRGQMPKACAYPDVLAGDLLEAAWHAIASVRE